MRYTVASTLRLGLCLLGFATETPAWAQLKFDESQPAEAQVPGLYQAWKAEKDPARRTAAADELVEAVIHEFDKQQPEIVDEVARDGAPENEIRFAGTTKNVTLEPCSVLDHARSNLNEYPVSPVFRRIGADRFEVWTPKDGWLFNGHGKVVTHVTVPRRDGTGRDWFGAFLPGGRWITTDLWNDDQQLNAFSPDAKWLWELDGQKIVAALPNPSTPDDPDLIIRPSFGWGRADKTGKRWLVSLGEDFTRGFAFVATDGKFQPLAAGTKLWQQVYPRDMGTRGFYIALYIDSDDGSVTLHREAAGHGVEVDWPRFSLTGSTWTKIIHLGNDRFGFWPGSHDVYIGADGDASTSPQRLWFFTQAGLYQAETIGVRLGDAANGRDLLVLDADNNVAELASNASGIQAVGARKFTWADGTTAIPLALCDDLHAGIFLRGPGLDGLSDAARVARATANLVVARWDATKE